MLTITNIIEELKILFDQISQFENILLKISEEKEIPIDVDLSIKYSRSEIETKINEMSIFFNEITPLKNRFEIIRNHYIKNILPDACKWNEVKNKE